MNKRRLGPCVTFFPQPTTLVTTVDSRGKANLMTASWAGVVSKTPPLMAVSFNRGRQSYQNLIETGCFVVNLVPASLAVVADFCGVRSGRDLDKLSLSGLELTAADQVAAPLLGQSPLNAECRVTQEIELGDYRLVLGEILEIHAAEEAFRNHPQGDARVFDPLVYLGGIREYWGLGEKVADAYKAGLGLVPDMDQ